MNSECGVSFIYVLKAYWKGGVVLLMSNIDQRVDVSGAGNTSIILVLTIFLYLQLFSPFTIFDLARYVIYYLISCISFSFFFFPLMNTINVISHLIMQGSIILSSVSLFFFFKEREERKSKKHTNKTSTHKIYTILQCLFL